VQVMMILVRTIGFSLGSSLLPVPGQSAR